MRLAEAREDAERLTVGEVFDLSAKRTALVGQLSFAVDEAVLTKPRERSLKMSTLLTS